MLCWMRGPDRGQDCVVIPWQATDHQRSFPGLWMIMDLRAFQRGIRRLSFYLSITYLCALSDHRNELMDFPISIILNKRPYARGTQKEKIAQTQGR